MATNNINLTKLNIRITPVSPDNAFVQKLIAKLDKYQIELYGIECCHLDSVAELQKCGAYMIGAFADEVLIGIGAVKIFDKYAEIKRMFVEEAYRGLGMAGKILIALEDYAAHKGKEKIYLETGSLQYSALNFYKRIGYSIVERFGDYAPNDVSVYFEKKVWA